MGHWLTDRPGLVTLSWPITVDLPPPQRGFGKEHPLLGTSLLSTGSLKVIADRTQRCSYLLVSSLRPSQKFFTNWQNYLPTVLTSYLVPQSTASGWEAEASLTLGFQFPVCWSHSAFIVLENCQGDRNLCVFLGLNWLTTCFFPKSTDQNLAQEFNQHFSLLLCGA